MGIETFMFSPFRFVWQGFPPRRRSLRRKEVITMMNVFLDSTASELGSQNNQKNISSSTISNKQKTKYVGEKTLATGDVSKDTKVTKEKNIFNN